MGRGSARVRRVLVPTAERESSLGLSIFPPIFRGVRGIMYNTFEERALITALSSNAHVPGFVVGVGSQIPDAVDPERARNKFGLHNPFVIYVGRIDANKGCADLFRNFIEYTDRLADRSTSC
jgi:glycosyltransferase involved in cell wall biosynthesis